MPVRRVLVAERLALSSRTSTMPVMVVTGSGDAALEHRAAAAGAVRILKKPVDPAALLDAVRDALGEPT